MHSLHIFQIVVAGQTFYEKKEGNYRTQYDLHFLYHYGDSAMIQQITPVSGYQDTYWNWHMHGHDTDDDFSFEALGYRNGEQCGKYISGNDLHPMTV